MEDTVEDIYLRAMALKSTDFMIHGHLKSCLRFLLRLGWRLNVSEPLQPLGHSSIGLLPVFPTQMTRNMVPALTSTSDRDNIHISL